jgi:hypothetical protein
MDSYDPLANDSLLNYRLSHDLYQITTSEELAGVTGGDQGPTYKIPKNLNMSFPPPSPPKPLTPEELDQFFDNWMRNISNGNR